MPDYDSWARSIRTPQNVAETWATKLQVAIDQFMIRQLSDTEFRGCLYALGFHGAILDCEFRLQDSIRNDREKMEDR